MSCFQGKQKKFSWRYFLNNLFLKLNIFVPLCTIIVVICTIIALLMASRSLQATTKARKDTFLPIIIADRIYFNTATKLGEVDFDNIGKGIAFDIRIELTGLTTNYINRELRVNHGDSWLFGLDDNDIGELEKLADQKEMILMISYEDIFKRKIQTEYRGKHEERKDGNRTFYRTDFFDCDSFKLILP